jgi:DNA polymerase-1
MALAILDIEMILHRAICAAEQEIEWAPNEWTYNVRLGQAKSAVLEEINAVRSVLPDHQLAIALGDSYSFRYFIWPEYKAARKKLRKPAGFSALLDWLTSAADTHGFAVLKMPQVEADDVIGLYAGPGDVIVSGDKDLMTVPGLHLDEDHQVYEISKKEADRKFFRQVLTGDTSDGYPGCPKVGEVNANKLLDPFFCSDPAEPNPLEVWEAILGAYAKAGLRPVDALIQARCARILRPGEYDWERNAPRLWSPPVASREVFEAEAA